MDAASHIFGVFVTIIADLPARRVITELDLQCRMLEHDLWDGRRPLTQEAFSILRFGQFVRAAKMGRDTCAVEAVPRGHLAFYKTTLIRLIHANELPPSATEQFNHTFSVAA